LGYEVETDGRVVRLRIPADQLFQSNTAQLTPSAANILDRVSDVIKSEYSTQRIAIEGHTDNGPIYGGSYSTPHQLASAQTNAVFEHMTRRNQLPTTQLFTLAHGSNYPLEDNQSAGGRASNRRIEFVVYPETF
jgi:chemotaxis protein MotB